MNWTEIVLGLFTLLSACGWFVSGRKHRQVSIDAFDLRMMGENHDNPEHFASLGRGSSFADEDEFNQIKTCQTTKS